MGGRDGYDAIASDGAPPAESRKDWLRRQALAVVYGVVATAMCAPVMMSFASIIFSDHFFAPYLPSLVKLVLFSAAVHQICYVASSTMEFAVGQVQDAGLIFLSAMARAVVADGEALAGRAHSLLAHAKHEEHRAEGLVSDPAALGPAASGDDIICATALWSLGAATASLGLMLVIIGKLRLASLAQYLPVPVVGGYLAYIGFYCGQAGLAMMTGVQLLSIRDWPHMVKAEYALAKVGVGFAVCGAIMILHKVAAKRKWSRTQGAAIIPGTLFGAILGFYALKLAWGFSLDDARHGGWVGETPEAADAADAGTGWRSIQVLRPWQLYVPEGGGPAVLAGVARMLPRVLVSWLAMVCVVAFSSSLDVAAIEMELGRPLDYDSELQTVGLGNLVSGLCGGFSGSYIFSQTILNMRGKVANRVSGTVVFILEMVLVFGCPVPPTAFVPTGALGGLLLLIAESLMVEWLLESRHNFSRSEYAVCLFTFGAIHALGLEAGFAAGLVAAGLSFAAQYASADDETGGVGARKSPRTRSVARRDFEQRLILDGRRESITTLDLRGFVFFGAAAALLDRLKKEVFQGDEPASPTGDVETSHKPSWVVLNCDDLSGVDATAVRACFVPFQQLLTKRRATLLFTGLRPHVSKTLEAHGVQLQGKVFETADAALEAAEDALLEADGGARVKSFDEVARAASGSFDDMKKASAGDPCRGLRAILGDYLTVAAGGAAEDGLALRRETALETYFERTRVRQGEPLFRSGDAADVIYFVQCGAVDLFSDDQGTRRRIMRVKRGGVLGELCFLLGQRQRLAATAATHTDLWVLSRRAFDAVRRDRPALHNLLQTALLKSMALQVEESLASGAVF